LQRLAGDLHAVHTNAYDYAGATQHYAVNDYGAAHRVVERVTVSGARAVGLDGWQSRPIRGDNSPYQTGRSAPGTLPENERVATTPSPTAEPPKGAGTG
jgi:hypothetical protein